MTGGITGIDPADGPVIAETMPEIQPGVHVTRRSGDPEEEVSPSAVRRFAGGSLIAAAVVVFLAAHAAAFVAYFVTTSGHPPTDGFGRFLEPAPSFGRLILGADRLWAGWLWFGFDCVAYWGSLAAAYGCGSFGMALRAPAVRPTRQSDLVAEEERRAFDPSGTLGREN